MIAESNQGKFSRRSLMLFGTALSAVSGTSIANLLGANSADAATDVATPLTTSPTGDPTLFSSRRRGVPIRGWDQAASWNVKSAAGTLTSELDDPDQPKRLRLVTDVGAASTVALATTFTVRNGGGLALRIKRDSNLQSISVTVVTGPYGRPKTMHTDTGSGPVPVGQWYDMVLPTAFLLRYSDVGADIQWSTELQITAVPLAGKSSTLDIAEPRVVQGDGRPRVLWAFDDGRLDQYQLAYPVLAASSYTGTIAVEYNTVGTANRCTLQQYQELYVAGWEFIAHHTSQITPLTNQAAETIFRGAREWSQANAFLRGMSHWVWPGGLWDLEKDRIASRYFLTRRKVSPLSNCIVPGVYDPCDPPVYYITQSRPLSDAKAYLDRVAASGNTAHFAFHSLTNSSPAAPEDWTLSDFQALVAYAKQKGFVSTSYDEVFGISG